MRRRIPIFYSAILLTLVNLLLRFIGTSFQVYLSGLIGAAGVGLLQLVMSVGGLAVVAGMAGIRTATMYLTAEEFGKQHPERIAHVLSACFLYSFLCSGSVALTLYAFAPWISTSWIGEPAAKDAIRMFAAFLPTSCLSGVMTGYFTAANRIGTLSAVQVFEQLFSMAITLLTLHFCSAEDPVRACQCILLGSGISGCVSLILLMLLRNREKHPSEVRIPIGKKLAATALPLAAADCLKAGINTAENLMVPKRLAIHPAIVTPLAAFGTVSGMVFPLLMFPACILFGLAELLIPELARCSAGGNDLRSRYLVRKSLRIAMLYGTVLCGLMYLLADTLCLKFYGSVDAARELRRYSLLIPMLYCDAITDAMTKGLGQQKICVRYNILTSSMDVILLYQLLPRYGMDGYFFSFFITHLLNFLLSLRRLLWITSEKISPWMPFRALCSLAVAISLCSLLTSVLYQAAAFLALIFSLFTLLGIIGADDLHWFRGIASVCKKESGLH